MENYLDDIVLCSVDLNNFLRVGYIRKTALINKKRI